MWAADWKDTSYWLDDLPQTSGVSSDIKNKVDVLVIGSGYTGLNAALEIARGGRDVMVVESGYPGYGCSTRNGGQISTHVKPSLEKLTQKVGASQASAMRQEGVNALDWIEELVTKEKLDCNFLRAGRFHAAHSGEHYDDIARDAEKLTKYENIPTEVVPKAEQHKELGTDIYHGGVVFPRHASVHPAKYHHGLLSRVIEAGATVVGYCEAQHIEKLDKGFNTLVGENGTRLSGGEKQRISIARAFLRKSKIILLDEPTSSLDSETENKIQIALKKLTENKTTIVIAHRLSTIKSASKIFVIDNGNLAATGTHNELLSSSDIYTNFYNKQIRSN